MLSNRNGKVDDLEMFVFVGNSYDFVERFISFVMSENQVYIFFCVQGNTILYEC